MLSIRQVVEHPMYAGAYAYGRRPHQRIRTASGERTRQGNWVPMEQWKVLKRDCLPAYITWERYLANQGCLHQHSSRPGTKGSPRNGSALLTGLVVCGNCGRRLKTDHPAHGKSYYRCARHLYEATEQACFGLKAVATSHHEGYSSGQIADTLNQEGFSPPKRCGGFYAELVRELLVRRGLAKDKTYVDQLGPHEWWLPKLAEALPVSAGKLADGARRGWLHSRRTPPQWLWVLRADKQEVMRFRELASLSHRGVVEHPAELTTPKKRR